MFNWFMGISLSFLICGAAVVGVKAMEKDVIFANTADIGQLKFESSGSLVFQIQIQDSRQLQIEGGYEDSYERLFSMFNELILAHPEEMRNIFLSKHITYYGEDGSCVGFRCAIIGD